MQFPCHLHPKCVFLYSIWGVPVVWSGSSSPRSAIARADSSHTLEGKPACLRQSLSEHCGSSSHSKCRGMQPWREFCALMLRVLQWTDGEKVSQLEAAREQGALWRDVQGRDLCHHTPLQHQALWSVRVGGYLVAIRAIPTSVPI
eukprot:1464704-Rhodomonas_salina.4